MLNLAKLIDDAKCYEIVRQMRWSQGVSCPRCECHEVIKRGKNETQPEVKDISVRVAAFISMI